MAEYIKKDDIYAEIANLEELARDRFLDTPFDSPVRERYRAQLDARTEMKHLIADAPPADVAPVRHGRWIPSDMGGGNLDEAYVCSTCGEPFVMTDGMTPMENSFNYCPHCGAKMDGEAQP